MRWSKIKNIILLLLVVVNVCLLVMVGLRAGRTARSERETRERMITILERGGIAFAPEEVPGAMPLSSLRVTASPMGEAEAALLVGPVSKVATVGSRILYTGEKGTVTFSPTGEASAEFDAAAWPLDGTDADQAGAELLEALGLRVQEESRETQGSTLWLTFTQLWEGTPVPNLAVTLTYQDGALRQLSGRWLTGTAERAAGENLLTASTALSRFLEALNKEGYVCSGITEMYAGYAAGGTGLVTLTPAWYIETDTWPWRYAVDAVTGAVTAAE